MVTTAKGQLGTLLVVDDDPSLLRLLKEYLTRLNYDVVACSTGEEAWSRFQADPDIVELVLVDLSMPNMSGEELLRKIRSLVPDAPVLVCSGYPLDISCFPGVDCRRTGFLQKPFLPSKLGRAVEELRGHAQIAVT